VAGAGAIPRPRTRAWRICARRARRYGGVERCVEGRCDLDRRAAGRRSIAQIRFSLARPGLLVRQRQRIEILWRGGPVVYPFAKKRTSVDHVDGELAMLVFVGEVAPQRVLRIEQPDGLERQRLQAPRLEGVVTVIRTFGVDLHAVAELAGVLVERR